MICPYRRTSAPPGRCRNAILCQEVSSAAPHVLEIEPRSFRDSPKRYGYIIRRVQPDYSSARHILCLAPGALGHAILFSS